MESSLEYSFRHLTELDQKIKTKVSIIFSTHNASPYASPLSLDWLANNDDGCCAEKEVCIVRTGQASVPKNRSATLAYSQLRVKEVAELVPGLLAGRHRGCARFQRLVRCNAGAFCGSISASRRLPLSPEL